VAEGSDAAAAGLIADARRIMIIGPPGAGKSTLALVLSAVLGLPAVHLDQMFWQPGWVPRDGAAFAALLGAAQAQPCWIMEGNYARSLPERLRLADLVIWLDYGRWICLFRVLWRLVRTYGRTRADMAPGCRERFDLEFLRYIWSFPRVERPRLVAAVEADGGRAHVVMLHSSSQTARFLMSLT